MTVEVDSGPGPGLYQSTKFTATVNGSTSHVYGYTRTAPAKSIAWSSGDSVDVSWITFGANQTTSVVITRLAGSITSYTIYPKNVEVSPTLAGGKLTIQVPVNTRLYIELNGDRKHTLLVMASPLKATVPANKTNWTSLTPATVSSIDTGTNVITTTGAHGYVDNQRIHVWTTGTYPTVSGAAITSLEVYFVRFVDATHFALRRTSGGADVDLTSAGTGTITFTTAQWTDTVNALYFPAGVHTIGRQFYVATNTHVYFDRGAVVIGSFWSSDQTGVTIDGAGVLSGAFSTWEVAVALTSFYDQIKFSMFYGSAEAPYIGHSTTAVRGITCVALPWYGSFRFATEWTNCHFLAPWTWNSDGGDLIRNDDTSESTGFVDGCLFFVADDCFKVAGNSYTPGFSTVRNSLFIPTGSSALHNGYFREQWNNADPHYPHYTSWENCDVVQLALGDIESGETTFAVGQTSIVKCMVSCRKENSRAGRQHISVSDLRVWGPTHGRFCYLSVGQYPYSDPGADPNTGEYGQIADISFERVSIETAPLQQGKVDAAQWWSAPHDITFSDISIEGVRLSHRTASAYFDIDARAYRVFFEDVLMTSAVDLCNRALANLGQRPTLTSIAPPDTTYEAQLCATLFQSTMNTVLERCEWEFMLTRVALDLVDPAENSDIDAWAFAYQIPAGMLKPIAVVGPGMTADYTVDGSVVPQEFVIERHSTGVLCIYTNVEDAVLRYSVYVTDPNLLPPTLQDGLAWLLASKLAGPLIKGDVGVTTARSALQHAEYYLGRASTLSGEKREVKPDRLPSSIAAR